MQPERQAHDCREGIRRSRMYPGKDRGIWRHSGLEVVLSFVVVPIAQVVEGEVEFDPAPNLLCYAQVENGVACGDD